MLEHIVRLFVMHGFTRILIEELGDETEGIEGVHLEDEDGWVLIYPSCNHACFHIY